MNVLLLRTQEMMSSIIDFYNKRDLGLFCGLFCMYMLWDARLMLEKGVIRLY